jgi:hypothetical protein
VRAFEIYSHRAKAQNFENYLDAALKGGLSTVYFFRSAQ